ncbi:MAG: ABC transporter substrate-binding protein [Anaerolineales bacterium]|nr:ABC transporter substrate-binding protein [Anaerolineales bacterium]
MSTKSLAFRVLTLLGVLALMLAACGPKPIEAPPATKAPTVTEAPAATEAPANEAQFENFTWWTAGGEAEGLNGMYEVFNALYPGVEIINAAIAGGGGTVAKPVLVTRLAGGDPPDAFQVHVGQEILMYSPEQYIQPLDDLYAEQGWDQIFPQDLLPLLQNNGHYWLVPVNIHRGNVLWYNKQIFEENGLTPPTTFDEFFAICETLQAKGITPYGFGNGGGWEDGFTFESFILGTLGPEGYKSLWAGATPWTDPGVTQALENYWKALGYANTDHAAISWDGAAQLIVEGKAAMFIHGDWTNGYFIAKAFDGFGWAAAPGSVGSFHVISDGFAMPKGIKNPVNAKSWMIVAGSKAGQEAFNPKKGSICARTDCDPNIYSDYLKWSAGDFASNALVPGSDIAGHPQWVTALKDIMVIFAQNGDVAAAQAAMQQACLDAGVCK